MESFDEKFNLNASFSQELVEIFEAAGDMVCNAMMKSQGNE